MSNTITYNDDIKVEKESTKSILTDLILFHDIIYEQTRTSIGKTKSFTSDKVKVLAISGESGCYNVKISISKEVGDNNPLVMKYRMVSPNDVEVLKFTGEYTEEEKFREDLDTILNKIQDL